MAIKFSQFNLRTDSTPTMFLVGYDGNQNIHITVDNLLDDFINGTENTIAMFGEGGHKVIDSMVTQNAEATLLTVAGGLNVDTDATFDGAITVTGDSTLNGNVVLGNESADLITQTGTLYLNGPIKDTTDTLGIEDQILVSDAAGELNFQDLLATHVGSAEVVKVPVKNLEGSPLTKGDPVYISGSVGTSGKLEVGLADASNAAKMPAVGLLLQDLGIEEEGFVVITGKLRNLPTDPIDGQPSFPNDVIYVKGGGVTGAALTLTKPVGTDLIQNMGKVGRASTSNDGTFVVSSILRTNDIPNLTPGKIWVGSTGNTIESSSITFTEATGAVQLNEYGINTHTGTVAYNLSVDASGNVIETTAVPANIVETLTAASGTYISLTDATDATGEVDLGTFDLNAVDGTAVAGERYLTKNNTWAEVATIPGTYTFDVTADSGTSQTILSGETLDIAGGTYITTSVGDTDTVTITHDDTDRVDTTSTESPGYGGSFTAVDIISTNDQGHLTAVNLKTVTMPSADNTNTTYDLSGVGGANGTAGVRLAGSDTTNDDVLIVGAGTTGVVRTNNTLTITSNDQYTGTVTSVATGGGLTGGTITTSGTISHADTSSQASVNNSAGTVIQDVTLDIYGHVTGLGTVDLDNRYVNVTGDTMTGALTVDAKFTANDSEKHEPSVVYDADAGQVLKNEDSELAIGLGSVYPTAINYPLWLQGRKNDNTARNICLQPVDGSVQIGVDNFNADKGSLATGYENAINGKFSFATGKLNVLGASEATAAIGRLNQVNGLGSTAIGNSNTVTRKDTVVMGRANTANNDDNFILGFANTTQKIQNIAVGRFNNLNSPKIVVVGHSNTSSATTDNSTSVGYANNSQHVNSHLFGVGLQSHQDKEVIIGKHNDTPSNPIGASARGANVIIGVGTGQNAGANMNAVEYYGFNDGSMQVIHKALYNSSSYANDTEAAAGGVPPGGLYRNNNDVKIRMT